MLTLLAFPVFSTSLGPFSGGEGKYLLGEGQILISLLLPTRGSGSGAHPSHSGGWKASRAGVMIMVDSQCKRVRKIAEEKK